MKTNAQRREIARLRMEAHLLQQEANRLQGGMSRTAKAALVWAGLVFSVVMVGISQQPETPPRPVTTPRPAPVHHWPMTTTSVVPQVIV